MTREQTALSNAAALKVHNPIQTAFTNEKSPKSCSVNKDKSRIHSSEALATSGYKWWWCTKCQPVPGPGCLETRAAARRRRLLLAPQSFPQSTSGWSQSPVNTCWASRTRCPSAHSHPAQAVLRWTPPSRASWGPNHSEDKFEWFCHWPVETTWAIKCAAILQVHGLVGSMG